MTPKRQRFVECYLMETPGFGAQTRAARRAGFGSSTSTPALMASIASQLIRRPEIVNAIQAAGGIILKRQKKFLGKANCVVCGESFDKSAYNQKACSETCAQRRDRVLQRSSREKNFIPRPAREVGCRYCGRMFMIRGNGFYCSPLCVDAVLHKKWRDVVMRQMNKRLVAHRVLAGLGVKSELKLARKALKELGIEI